MLLFFFARLGTIPTGPTVVQFDVDLIGHPRAGENESRGCCGAKDGKPNLRRGEGQFTPVGWVMQGMILSSCIGIIWDYNMPDVNS